MEAHRYRSIAYRANCIIMKGCKYRHYLRGVNTGECWRIHREGLKYPLLYAVGSGLSALLAGYLQNSDTYLDLPS